MPPGEEEQRRRCIIDPTECTSGLTQESALAEELARYDTGNEVSGVAKESGYYKMAKGLLAHFTLGKKKGKE
jgi:hypothetical protein